MLTNAAVVAAIVAIALISTIIIFVRLHRPKEPVTITYLIPREYYKMRNFQGAPKKEQYPNKLIVGIGDYQIMCLIKLNLDIVVSGVTIRFNGENAPDNIGSSNPFIIEWKERNNGRYIYKDWHGIWHTPPSESSRSFPAKGMRVMGNLIRTTGAYEGYMRVTVSIQEPKSFDYVKNLKFIVDSTGNKDQIPFLSNGLEP